jgi:hypothetical protein
MIFTMQKRNSPSDPISKDVLTFDAPGVSVSCQVRRTGAHSLVVLHCALGTVTTRSFARILALPVDASKRSRTLRVHHAFGMTVRRSSVEIRQTRADWASALHTTLGVGTTGTRIARVVL